MGKIIQENAFEKEKPGLKSNHGLALIGLRETGPWVKRGKMEESFSLVQLLAAA